MRLVVLPAAVAVWVGACLLHRTGALDDYSGGAAPGGDGGIAGAVFVVGGAGGDAAGGMMGGAGGTPGGFGGTGGAPVPEVPCEAGMCAAGEVCCAMLATNVKVGCAAESFCMGGEFEIACNGPEDCRGNEDCCGQWTGTSWSGIACQATCEFASGGRVMCAGSTANCPTSHPTCVTSTLLSGYYYCN